MNDYITTTKQSTTKPRAYFLGYTVIDNIPLIFEYASFIHTRVSLPGQIYCFS